MANLRRVLIGLLLPIGGLRILVGCGQAEFETSTPGSTPMPTPSVSPQPNGKATYEAMLEATSVAVIATAWAEQTVIALTPTVPASPVVIITDTPVPLGLGIFAPAYQDFSASEWNAENLWRGLVDETYIVVYAGAYHHARDQGFVCVETLSLRHVEVSSRDFYDTPTMAGSVHVVAADGLRLTLLATSGVQFVFDAGTRQWLTLTPGPSPSPGLSPVPTGTP